MPFKEFRNQRVPEGKVIAGQNFYATAIASSKKLPQEQQHILRIRYKHVSSGYDVALCGSFDYTNLISELADCRSCRCRINTCTVAEADHPEFFPGSVGLNLFEPVVDKFDAV